MRKLKRSASPWFWACERFHGFVHGDPSLTVHTDHKPLIPLINTRDLNRVQLRCQRLLMRLMKYNPAAVYIPGKQLVVADALSRAPDASVDTPTSQLAEEIFMSTITSEIVSACKAEELAANTAADTVLQQVLQYTKSGWPDSAHLVEDAVRPFFHERALLSCSNGVLYHCTKLHCASLIFSLHSHDLDDRLRLLLVQYDYQNGGCRCFRLKLPRHLQMRRTSKPPRVKNHF